MQIYETPLKDGFHILGKYNLKYKITYLPFYDKEKTYHSGPIPFSPFIQKHQSHFKQKLTQKRPYTTKKKSSIKFMLTIKSGKWESY